MKQKQKNENINKLLTIISSKNCNKHFMRSNEIPKIHKSIFHNN